MRSSKRKSHSCRARRKAVSPSTRWPRWLRIWFFASSFATGVLAALWLLLRSGIKPSRLAYPCQQAAAGAAVTSFALPVVSSLVLARRRILAQLQSRVARVVLIAAVACVLTYYSVASNESSSSITILDPPADYFPELFLVNEARGIEPGRYGGVDDLISLMGMHGLKWHRSQTVGLTAGMDGLIDVADVVVLKINSQWAERGGTNTDVLRGVIRQVVEHPDGFVGEIVVADNGQGVGSMTRVTDNNAHDRTQSAQDVVDDFVAEGWAVSTMRWDTIRGISVTDYDTGNLADGYVVNPTKDPQTSINVSYPKFQTAGGAFVSYKNGVWLPGSQSYDPDRLTVINIPVLKTHFIYGVTAAVKNHMGVLTNTGTDSHAGVGRGGLGSLLAEVRRPDLTLLDCIWILAHPTWGPDARYGEVDRHDQLLAGTDPVALDIWATKHILIPQIRRNGYTVADYGTRQDPDNPSSVFRNYLDRSMNEMLMAGINTTNDYNAVTLHEWRSPPIPTISTWGAILLCLLILTAATLRLPSTARNLDN